MNKTIKLGLALAFVSMAMSSLGKLISPDVMLSKWYMIAGFVIPLLLSVVLGRLFLRDKDSGEILSYGAAMKHLFVAFMISYLLGNIFANILYSNDAEMKAAFEEYQITSQEAAYRWGGEMSGASEAQIQEGLEELREQRENGQGPSGASYPYTWSGLPLTIVISTVFSLIFSLITALLVREKGDQLHT